MLRPASLVFSVKVKPGTNRCRTVICVLFRFASSTPLTTYYRRTFNVADANAVSTLTASLVADDGAVVYLNGVEVARDNMPAGGVTAVTPALSSRVGADENAAHE